mmetsp:Transcript_4079/g.6448  ORF Transcript_4079/g.6448 Transcript_4079/m.6448 type:complete len:423 (+) Transcript_4079:118-1386(+)
MTAVIRNAARLREGDMALVPDYLRGQIMESIHTKNQLYLYGDTLRALVCGTHFSSINLRNASNVRDSDLQALAPWFQKLKKLDLSACCYVTDCGLAPALSQCMELESLDMEWMTSVTGEGTFLETDEDLLHVEGGDEELCGLDLGQLMRERLDAISLCMRQLTKLSTLGCTKMSEDALLKLSKVTLALRDLNYSWCQQITDDSFAALQCTSLTRLSMSYNPKITDFAIQSVARKCPLLEFLDISGCPDICDAGLKSVAARLELLKAVNISFLERITDKGVEMLAIGCPLLASLDCEQTNIGDPSLMAIADYSKDLRSLNVGFCHNLSEGAIMICWSRCKLHTLNVNQCRGVSMQTRFWLMAKSGRSKQGAEGPIGQNKTEDGSPQLMNIQGELISPPTPADGSFLPSTAQGEETNWSGLATY